MPDNWTTGRALAALRMAHGWTQAELAERSGVAKAQISRYERGKGQPSVRILTRLAEALHLSLVEFHHWQEDLRQLVERRSAEPPPRPSAPVVDWPLPVGRMPWETEADAVPPGDDRDVELLARDTGKLAERFVRLHFRNLERRSE